MAFLRATDPAQKLQRDNLSCRIQTPYITRIAGNYEVLPLPGDDPDRRVDNIRSLRGAAEFSAGTSQLVVKRNKLNLLAPQEPRLGNRNATVAPGVPHDARRHAESPALD